MDLSDIISWIVVGLMVLCVMGIGIGSVAYSYYEEARARKERRERAFNRRTEATDEALAGGSSALGDARGWMPRE